MSESSEQFADIQRLILVAFRTAAQQQKPEWHRMQGCVLKNRLLNQTERSFDEREYGTDRFSDLVARLDVLLTVDHSETPYIVELREPFRSQIEPQEFTDSSERSQRIRSDLWHAIVDYSSTRGWVWDQLQGLAVDAKSSDVTADALWIPTLNELDLREWRAKFAEASSDRISEAETEDFDNWIRAGLGTDALPRRFRGPWNGWMKRQVRERLLAFFEEHEIEPPSDLLVSQESLRSPAELRSYIAKCIALMSDEELRELRIPAEVAMRAHQ